MSGSVRSQYNLWRSFPGFSNPPLASLMHQEGPRDLPTPTIDVSGWPVGMWRVIWAAEGVLGAEMSHFDHIDARARMCQNDLKCAARRWTSFLRLLTDSGFL